MRKYIILITISMLLTGCFFSKENDDDADKQYIEYKEYYRSLTSNTNFDTESKDFDVKLILNTTNKNNTRYDIIIDNPKISMYNIKAIVKIANDKSDSYPTIGLLESNVFHLVPNTVDKENNFYKGINLSGITKLKAIEVHVYLTFTTTKDIDSKINERYIKLYGQNAS